MATKKRGRQKSAGGRPPRPDRAAIRATLLARISAGELVKDVCADLKISADTPYKWAATDEEFGRLYARAREEQGHAWAEKALSVAEGADALTQAREQAIEDYADELVERGDPTAAAKVRALEANLIQRDRLRVDTLKWMASKVAPRSYGEKVTAEVTGEGGGAVKVEHVIRWGGLEIPL